MPEEFRSYQQWSEILKSPLPVPAEFWFKCMPTTAADWSAAREKYGPHTQRYIRVYANEAARAGLALSRSPVFGAGATLVKEKLLGSPDHAPDGIAFMVKRKPGTFSETNGWEFLYFPASGDARLTHESCARCHRAAPTDYVFGRYAK